MKITIEQSRPVRKFVAGDLIQFKGGKTVALVTEIGSLVLLSDTVEGEPGCYLAETEWFAELWEPFSGKITMEQ